MTVCNNKYRTAVFLVCWLFAAAGLAAREDGPRYALIVGNADYRYISRLNNTARDARDMAAALEKLGFQVDLRIDVTAAQFAGAVKAYTAKLAADRRSEGFFWFTGHGAQMRGENYLLATDIRAGSPEDLRDNSVSLNQVLWECEAARNKVNILVVDACRTDPFPAASRTFRGAGLAAVKDVPGDLVIMFSTSPNDVASDGPPGTNSPFARAFLTYINSPEPVNMMAPDVVRETMIITEGEQRPFMNGSIIGDKYYFLNPARVGEAGPAAPETAAVSTDPKTNTPPLDSFETINRNGIAFFAAEQFDDAIAAFTQAITRKPDYAEAYYNRGLVYFEIQAAGQAIADFTTAIRLDGNYAAAYFNRGLAYSGRQEYDRAMADYNETVRLAPSHAKARNNRGNMFVLRKDYDRAMADYNEAIRLNPMSAAAYRNRGGLYRLRGNRKEADADFERA
ncbi:MAG: tetratricopeptide repeat protein, partial [Spirochaetaceae bacterium]|nr:tetratricopeptide repeat protein [Spirochaetaceae bacterium]